MFVEMGEEMADDSVRTMEEILKCLTIGLDRFRIVPWRYAEDIVLGQAVEFDRIGPAVFLLRFTDTFVPVGRNVTCHGLPFD